MPSWWAVMRCGWTGPTTMAAGFIRFSISARFRRRRRTRRSRNSRRQVLKKVLEVPKPPKGADDRTYMPNASTRLAAPPADQVSDKRRGRRQPLLEAPATLFDESAPFLSPGYLVRVHDISLAGIGFRIDKQLAA